MSKLWRVGQKSKLLFDRENWGNIALEKAKKISFRFESYEFEVENFAIALPGLCYIVAGYLVRKEYITSMDFVAWIRRNMMRISGFLLDIWDEGTRRAEKRFPDKINRYYRTIKIDSIEDLWKSLDVILEWFSVFIVPRLEERGIPHALKEVAPIKATIKKLYRHYA
ncbi:MAG: hypothetical protein GF353_29520 [Candidatus Lokiarchaeota archaeon]|nr:hypothetical protein [Candidatus Lokiarchaeota archaeon]